MRGLPVVTDENDDVPQELPEHQKMLQVAAWLPMRAHIQVEVLVLPRLRAKKKRTTTAVTWRLLTRELLQQINEVPNAKKKAKATGKKSSKRKQVRNSNEKTSARRSEPVTTSVVAFIEETLV
ncbi:hypothetical protein GN958_ATG18090 [Phytophthora infestans]|uniref:Uncharacterized protein n=1 Tax=Phytophthora infestans TaxID=4787 RepID=A0A8S9TVI8_PHYIN|nr:hypothetical protein GN958_ATG18090 [Phytophthora infestans]